VLWEREDLTHVMDLDLEKDGKGLLAAALHADADDPEGDVINCPVPEEDGRFDAAVDAAYFQRYGSRKALLRLT